MWAAIFPVLYFNPKLSSATPRILKFVNCTVRSISWILSLPVFSRCLQGLRSRDRLTYTFWCKGTIALRIKRQIWRSANKGTAADSGVDNTIRRSAGSCISPVLITWWQVPYPTVSFGGRLHLNVTFSNSTFFWTAMK